MGRKKTVKTAPRDGEQENTQQLISCFQNLANSIRAKGVTGTMTPEQMAEKIRSIQLRSKWGATIDNLLGDVDANGVLQPPTSTPFEFVAEDIIILKKKQFYCLFNGNSGITKFKMPNLTQIDRMSLQSVCWNCTNLVEVDLRNLNSTNSQNGMQAAFQGCTSLRTVYLNKFQNSSTSLNLTFSGCSSLETVFFTEVTSVPPLSTVTTFGNTNSTYYIVVPDNLVTTWKAATNWSDSSIVNHIIGLSDYNNL